MIIIEKREIIEEYIKCDFCPRCDKLGRISIIKCSHCGKDVCRDHLNEIESGHEEYEIPVDKAYNYQQ